MSRTPRTPGPVRAALAAATLSAMAGAAAGQDASPSPHDYPTAERVIWVEACMREHPDAGHYEMLNKCSCALDYIARKLTFDEYDTMHTAALAATIGGERGAVFRDTPEMQDKIKAFRKLQSEAQAACMIAPPARR
jgi:hypothetical protein